MKTLFLILTGLIIGLGFSAALKQFLEILLNRDKYTPGQFFQAWSSQVLIIASIITVGVIIAASILKT